MFKTKTSTVAACAQVLQFPAGCKVVRVEVDSMDVPVQERRVLVLLDISDALVEALSKKARAQ